MPFNVSCKLSVIKAQINFPSLPILHGLHGLHAGAIPTCPQITVR